MSEENVEIVRRVFAAEEHRDAQTLHSLIDDDVQIEFSGSPFGDFADPGPRRGREDVQDAFRDWYAAFDNVKSDVTELIDLGEQVVSVFTYRGTGRSSGIEVEFKDMAGLWTIRKGRVVRIVWLRSREEALEAAELSE